MRALGIVILLLLSGLPGLARAQTYFLMAEQDGCVWCDRWHAEIAPIWPKTAEGAAMPLRSYNIRRDDPGVRLARPVNFTPTFIVVRDGVEIDRIEGYPGDTLFWSMVSVVIDRTGIKLPEKPKKEAG